MSKTYQTNGTPRYRMIAIDLDGTLLTHHGNVSPRTKEAVHRCLAEGLLVCFATGRNWTESRAVLEAVGHYDTAVFAGGAMVVDTKNEVMLHRQLVDPQLARELCGFFEDRGYCAMALQDRAACGLDYLASADVELDESTKLWVELFGAGLHRRSDLRTFGHEHTVRVGTVTPAVDAGRTVADLRDRFGERITTHSIRIPQFGSEVIEVFDPAVNKWAGILMVARRHGIKPEQIVAVGDDVNDLPMLTRAGLG
ncbi:MAG TPA: HAD family hydrolase, partial [Tepidisphaeraceae bacterium]|nr:HAD family hydrolase [Tepidisphaeraceae bacterium]